MSFDTSIKDSLVRINSLKFKILLMIDESRRLVGTVTEGDIRRGLISGLQLNDKIESVVNRSPIVITESESIQEKIRAMDRFAIDFIPRVNSERKILDLYTRQSKKLGEIENPVLLMAGGLGKRLQPLTINTPKPMIKIGNNSLIEIHIKRLVEFGFKNISVSVHYLKHEVMSALGDGSNFGASINYIEEETPLGTVGCARLLENPDKLPILIINSDVLTEIDFYKMLIYHERSLNSITVGSYEYQYEIPYGVISTSNNFISKIIEKPQYTIDIYAGISVLSTSVINLLTPYAKMDMPDLIELALKNGSQIGHYSIGPYWKDIGNLNSLESARKEISSNLSGYDAEL